MIQLAKLMMGALLATALLSGCNERFSVRPDRRKYQAQKSTGQAKQLKRRALDRLRDSVNSAEPLLKMRGIESCVNLGLPNAQEICIKAVSSPAPELQFVGAMGLLELATPAAQKALQNRLSSPDASVRLAVIGALHRLGQAEHSGELITALSSPSPKIRSNALMILGRLGDKSPMLSIRQVLKKDDVERVRLQAAEALVLLGDEKVLPRLQLWQYSTNWQERIFAVQLMGQVRDKDLFVADLLQGLNDPNQLVQVQAARSLGQLGQQDGLHTALRYLYPTAEDKRFIAREMAVSMNQPRFIERMSQIRSMAALALGEIGNWEAAAGLTKALDDKDSQVALAAAVGSLRLLQKQR